MWLSEALNIDTVWQVLGQQVLMGKMELPGAVTLQQLSLQEFSELAAIAALAASDPQALTEP